MAKITIKSRYGVVPNALLNDPKISLRAKGLFAYLQAKPDGWKFSIERIALEHAEGMQAVRNAIHELEKAGYLKRVKVRDPKGKVIGWDYILTATPSSKNPSYGNPSYGNPSYGNPSGGLSTGGESVGYTKQDYIKQETKQDKRNKKDNISQSISNKPIDSLDKNRKRSINNILQSDSNITNREVDKKSISNTPNREVNKQSISKLTNRLVNEKSVSNPSIDPIAKISKAELESVWQEFDALISRFGNITNETRIRMAIIALGPEKTRSILSLAKGMPSLIDAIEVLRSNLPEEVDYAIV